MKNTLKIERAKKKISQKQLAEEMEVTNQAICNIEIGKSNPKVTFAMKLARFFGYTVDDIFSL